MTQNYRRSGAPRFRFRWMQLRPAWRVPAAWEGMTQAGGATLPAPIAGQVALNELVVHGWDLARATGQSFDPAESVVRGSYEFLAASPNPAARTHLWAGGPGSRRRFTAGQGHRAERARSVVGATK